MLKLFIDLNQDSLIAINQKLIMVLVQHNVATSYHRKKIIFEKGPSKATKYLRWQGLCIVISKIKLRSFGVKWNIKTTTGKNKLTLTIQGWWCSSNTRNRRWCILDKKKSWRIRMKLCMNNSKRHCFLTGLFFFVSYIYICSMR